MSQDKDIQQLCQDIGIDTQQGLRLWRICQRIFTDTTHLHGLTKTFRPMLELAAMLQDVADISQGDARRHAELIANALAAALRVNQRPILLETFRFQSRRTGVRWIEEQLDGRVDKELAARVAAIVRFASGLNQSRTDKTQYVGAVDDGEALEVFVSGGKSAVKDAGAALAEAELWNLVMPRPIRAVRVHEAKALPIAAITAHAAAAQVGKAIIRAQFERFTSRRFGLAFAGDPEYVHEMRVALRRLRAAMRVFKKALGQSLFAFDAEIRALAAALGAARDSDVFLEFLHGYAASAPRPHQAFLDRLIASEQRKRRRHYKLLLGAFDNEQYDSFQGRFSQMLLQQDAPTAARARQPVWKEAIRQLNRRLEEVLEYPPNLAKLSNAQQHKLRIACKRLRYTAEFFSCLWPGLGDVASPAQTLQDLLGEVHDACVFTDRAQQYAQRSRVPQKGPAQEALKGLRRHLKRRQQQRLGQSCRQWRNFRRPGNIKKLQQIIRSCRSE